MTFFDEASSEVKKLIFNLWCSIQSQHTHNVVDGLPSNIGEREMTLKSHEMWRRRKQKSMGLYTFKFTINIFIITCASAYRKATQKWIIDDIQKLIFYAWDWRRRRREETHHCLQYGKIDNNIAWGIRNILKVAMSCTLLAPFKCFLNAIIRIAPHQMGWGDHEAASLFGRLSDFAVLIKE